MVKQNTWLIIVAAIAFSFVFPAFGAGVKPFLNSLLIMLMFLSCLDLRISEIIKSLHDVKNITLMMAVVHLVSPLLIFFLKGYFPNEIFLGLIIAAAIPAGRSAVFLSNIYGGVPIKALVSTSLSNFFSPITVPLFVWLFAHTVIRINPLDMSSTILQLVVIPLVLAVIFGKTNAGKKLNVVSPSISVFVLFLIIVGIVSPLIDVVMANLGLSVVLGALISVLIIIDFSLGYLLGTGHADHVTYAISSSYKNYTLGTLLSLTVFNPTVALPSIIYTVVSNVLLVPLQFLFQSQPPHPRRHRRQKHLNILLFGLGLGAAIFLARSQAFTDFMVLIRPHLFLSAFLGGMMFASTFTIAAGALVLLNLAAIHPPLLLIIISGLGAAFCDILIFAFFKDRVAKDISPVYDEIITKSHFKKILHTQYFAWTLPVIGAFIIASPLPDELGVSLLGLTRMNTFKFVAVTLASHLFGISTLIAGTRLI